jgi:hypothetical protein
MTPTIKFFAIAVMAFTLSSLSLSSCSKDDDKNELAGTTWSITVTLLEEGSTVSTGFRFTSDDAVTMFASDGTTDISAKGIYAYSKPNITITVYAPQDEGGTVIYVGTIDGNKLKVSPSDDPTSILTFTKQ